MVWSAKPTPQSGYVNYPSSIDDILNDVLGSIVDEDGAIGATQEHLNNYAHVFVHITLLQDDIPQWRIILNGVPVKMTPTIPPPEPPIDVPEPPPGPDIDDPNADEDPDLIPSYDPNVPDLGDFTPVTGATVDTLITSNAVVVDSEGGGMVWPATVRGEGEPQLEVNESDNWVTDANLVVGDTIKLRLTSSLDPNTTRTATLHAPGVIKDFVVTTAT